MKCTIPEISWHNRDPVLSIDIQPSKSGLTVPPYRIATGGTDSHVVIWYVTVNECGLASVEVAADLQRHQRAVNTVRFSPSGQFLASGDDESVIIVWKPKTEQDISDIGSTEGDASKEQWVSFKTLRGHLEDVYDISWSMDSLHLISGSIDNTAIIWDVQKGRNLGILSGHGGFVQGVAWDPKNKYAATLSSDRTCRIHKISSKKLTAKIGKSTLPVPPGSDLSGKTMRLFHDDTLKSFFRRLSFSPDGELLITPSGVIEIPNTEKHINATYIFSRYDFTRPVVYLPSPHEYTVAVRFCPLLFKLREGNSLFSLPYRMVFAVATKNNVILYDTQQPEPFALISNIHYTRLTDLSWSSDGRLLIVSSTDGYCSIITFSENELGEEYEKLEVTPHGESPIMNSENNQSDVPIKNKQDSVTLSNELRTKKENEKESDTAAQIKNVSQDPTSFEIHKKNETRVSAPPVSEKTKSPRRIPLITLSSPRKKLLTPPKPSLKLQTKEMVHREEISSTSSFKAEHGKDKSCVDSCTENPEDITVNVQNSTNNSLFSQKGKRASPFHKEKDKLIAVTNQNNSLEYMEVEENVSDPTEEKSYSCSENKEQQDLPLESIEVINKNISRDSMEIDETTKEEKSSLRDVNSLGKTTNNRDSMEIDETTKEEKSSLKNVNSLGKKSCIDTTHRKDQVEEENEDNANVNAGNNILKGAECFSVKESRDNPSVSCEEKVENSPVKTCPGNSKESTPSKQTETPTEAGHIRTPNHASEDVANQQETPHNVPPVEKRTPRRVQFITIASPKSKKKLT